MLLNGIVSSRYYLFSISNLIAAFGGGLILGKATDVIKTPYLHGGSILAFFVGTILGLLFIQLLPKKLSKTIAPSFSVGCSLVSVILFYVYYNYSQNHYLSGYPSVIFFILLTLRFTFWFYSRVKRASESSGYQQSIAWVEFGYYAGMVLGLIFWKILNLDVSLEMALLIDAAFQFIAGSIDIYSFSLKTRPANISASPAQTVKVEQFSSDWCSRLSKSVIFLTVGVQVVIFSAAHYLSQTISTYLLATFYFGVAVAAFVCNRYKVFLSWNKDHDYAAMLYTNKQNIRIPLLLVLAIIFLNISAVCYEIYSDMSVHETFFNVIIVCVLVFLAAFAYEAISLSFLDRIGYEEEALNSSGLVMKTYGLMGVFSAIGFWILNIFHNNLFISLLMISSSILYTTLATLKREVSWGVSTQQGA
ncbi:hypothetical protein ACFORL_05630 [Legionella dresdenensis]|uniref:Uncharacterized protein n=1 Tax=Legionella dresdenensis TaxID=450200 RepID=A0ABV8CEV0_9GAMM